MKLLKIFVQRLLNCCNMRKICFLLLSVILASNGFSQDLNARVQILSPKIQSNNKRALDVLELAIRDFLNNRKWIADPVKSAERIDCNFVISILEWDGSNVFKAEAQIVSSRPIFGSSYNSQLLSVNDRNFDFNYSEGESLEYNEQNFSSNLTFMLAFYANIIAGMDYDSFSPMGGSPYYAKAQTIVNNAQNANFTGWKAFDNLKNRYWIAENLNSTSYAPLREILYNYHRKGLDAMAANPAEGRKAIAETLPALANLDKQKQGAILSQIFFSAKAEEIVGLFTKADPQEKIKIFNLMSDVDPANMSKYEALKKGK